MYANYAVIVGSWHTKEFDPKSTIVPLAVRRFTRSRDIPTVEVMNGFFDSITDEFRTELKHGNITRQKLLRVPGYRPSNFVRVSHIELFSFLASSAPDLYELHSLFWQDCFYSYEPVGHIRFDRTSGHDVDEMRRRALRV